MVKCKRCYWNVDKDLELCPHCNKKMYFNVYDFLIENSPLFTIFAFIGTMVALLPNITERFYGSIATNSTTVIPFDISVLLISSTVFGSVFLLLITITISHRVIEGRKNEKRSDEFSFIKIGDIERLIFALFFYPFIFSIFGFLALLFKPVSFFLIFLLFLVFILVYEFLILLEIGMKAPVKMAIIIAIILLILVVLAYQANIIHFIQNNSYVPSITLQGTGGINISSIYIPEKFNFIKVSLHPDFFS